MWILGILSDSPVGIWDYWQARCSRIAAITIISIRSPRSLRRPRARNILPRAATPARRRWPPSRNAIRSIGWAPTCDTTRWPARLLLTAPWFSAKAIGLADLVSLGCSQNHRRSCRFRPDTDDAAFLENHLRIFRALQFVDASGPDLPDLVGIRAAALFHIAAAPGHRRRPPRHHGGLPHLFLVAFSHGNIPLGPEGHRHLKGRAAGDIGAEPSRADRCAVDPYPAPESRVRDEVGVDEKCVLRVRIQAGALCAQRLVQANGQGVRGAFAGGRCLAAVPRGHPYHPIPDQSLGRQRRPHRETCQGAGANARYRDRFALFEQGMAPVQAARSANHLSSPVGSALRSAGGCPCLHGRARSVLPPGSARRAPVPLAQTRIVTPSSTHLVLIPSFNPGARLFSTVRSALNQWAPVWAVVDGSTDHSEHRLAEMPSAEPNLRVWVLPKNAGKGAAVLFGIKEAQALG